MHYLEENMLSVHKWNKNPPPFEEMQAVESNNLI